MAKLVKEIVGPASWTLPDGSKYTLTSDDITQMADSGNELIRDGFAIQAPYWHDEEAVPVMLGAMAPEDRQKLENSANNAGFWEEFWVDPQGMLVGKLDVPREEDAAKIGKTIKGCSAMIQDSWKHPQQTDDPKVYPKAMTHIALTNRPKAKDAAPFTPTVGMALSMELADEMLDSDEEEGGMVGELLAELGKLGISLPEDTTPENLAERLLVAAKALNNAEGGGDTTDKPPPGAGVKKPSPVVMALSEAAVEYALGRLELTAEELEVEAAKPKPVKMSDEQIAAMNWTKNQLAKSYVSRIDQLVNDGRMLPLEAKDVNDQYLGSIKVAFSSDGTPEETELDRVLKIYERREPGEKLTGLSDDQVTLQVYQSPSGKKFALAEMIKAQEMSADVDDQEQLDQATLDKQINADLVRAGVRQPVTS